MEMRRLLLWAGLALVLQHHGGAAHKLVCYFTNWAHSRPGPASIWPNDLDPFLCTHLVFAFASMNDHQLVAKDLQDEKILYPEFNRLKERNQALKTLLSVGGWNFGTSRFTAMLSTSATRERFISSAISLLRTHGFDGLDLCFLYPGLRGSPVQDRWNFLFLIQELLAAFQEEAQLTLRPRLLLSAAVSGDPHIIETAYNVPFLGRLLDFISVLTYDLHGSWEKFTGHNSPLFSLLGDPKSSAQALDYWRKWGAPSEKLLMGLPTYGRTFHLRQATENGLQAEAVGPASPGKYTKQPGFLAYYEICSFLRGAKKWWISHQFVPYAYKGEEWLGYDDATSFEYKALYIRRKHFGGAMVWTLDLDDVRGTFCGTGPFPLIHVLRHFLQKAEPSSTLLTKFWISTATNSSRTSPGRLTETEALTTDSGGLLPGGVTVPEVLTTDSQGLLPGGVNVTKALTTDSGGLLPGGVNVTKVLTTDLWGLLPGGVNVTKALTTDSGGLLPGGVTETEALTTDFGGLLPGGVTVPEALTTDLGGLLPGGEGAATETPRKAETVTTIPRGMMVSPARGTAPFVKPSVVLQGKTETPVEKTVTPVEKTVTPVEKAVTPVEKTVTPVEKTVTPVEKAVTPVEKTVTPVEKTMTPVAPE